MPGATRRSSPATRHRLERRELEGAGRLRSCAVSARPCSSSTINAPVRPTRRGHLQYQRAAASIRTLPARFPDARRATTAPPVRPIGPRHLTCSPRRTHGPVDASGDSLLSDFLRVRQRNCRPPRTLALVKPTGSPSYRKPHPGPFDPRGARSLWLSPSRSDKGILQRSVSGAASAISGAHVGLEGDRRGMRPTIPYHSITRRKAPP